MAPHPSRFGKARPMPPRLLVVHTSEGAENGTSAEALVAFISTPATATNVASYHYVADFDRVIPVVPDQFTAYANAGANDVSLSICYPGKANQLDADWHDAASTQQHEQVARWLAAKSLEYGIPLVKINAAQIVKGDRGVCGHFDITNAYHRTTHTDPGPNYPWAEVIGRAIELATPPSPPDQEDDDLNDVQAAQLAAIADQTAHVKDMGNQVTATYLSVENELKPAVASLTGTVDALAKRVAELERIGAWNQDAANEANATFVASSKTLQVVTGSG